MQVGHANPPNGGGWDDAGSGHPVGVRAKGQTRASPDSFWWDREPATEADVLRAVIFDADSALVDVEHDGPGTGLVDSVMSLFCAGIWVGVVSTRPREPGRNAWCGNFSVTGSSRRS